MGTRELCWVMEIVSNWMWWWLYNAMVHKLYLDKAVEKAKANGIAGNSVVCLTYTSWSLWVPFLHKFFEIKTDQKIYLVEYSKTFSKLITLLGPVWSLTLHSFYSKATWTHQTQAGCPVERRVRAYAPKPYCCAVSLTERSLRFHSLRGHRWVDHPSIIFSIWTRLLLYNHMSFVHN